MKHRHLVARERNTARMNAEQIPYTESNNGETLLVRQPWAAADFYPSTGTFRDVISGEVYKHNDFFEWYRQRKEQYTPATSKAVVFTGKGARRRMYVRHTK